MWMEQPPDLVKADNAVEMLNMVFSVTIGMFACFPIGDMMGTSTLIAQHFKLIEVAREQCLMSVCRGRGWIKAFIECKLDCTINIT